MRTSAALGAPDGLQDRPSCDSPFVAPPSSRILPEISVADFVGVGCEPGFHGVAVDSGQTLYPGGGRATYPEDETSCGGDGITVATAVCDRGEWFWNGCAIRCDNIDECAMGTDNCASDAACVDTDGSFTCTCNSGFEGDGTTCTDIDECSASTDNCASDATCANTHGSFTCTCNSGFEGIGIYCHDIDECSASADNCASDATCANTDGSFTCTCNSGFEGDGITCTDIDECSDPASCPLFGQKCINEVGGYSCICKVGFEPTQECGEELVCGLTFLGTCKAHEESCQDLELDASTAEGFESVCAESDFAGENGPVCYGQVSPELGAAGYDFFQVPGYEAAEAICSCRGMRLCSLAEIAGQVAANTGCGFDYNLVWTSEPCTSTAEPACGTTSGGTAFNGHKVVYGEDTAINSARDLQPALVDTCVSDGATGFSVRCCADAEHRRI